MKKYLILISLLALAFPARAQSSPAVSTTYRFSNITSANLSATLATASSETPSGESLASISTFKNPATGTYSITAVYR